MANNFYQGYFNPKNPEKCFNISLKKPPFYRSSWELRFMRYLDNNINVIQWGSEIFAIPYISTDGLQHNYWPDFIMEVKTNDNTLVKYIIEIKPYLQSEYSEYNGTKSGRKNAKRELNHAILCETVSKNKKKWEAAKQFCEENGFKFQVITEKELGIR